MEATDAQRQQWLDEMPGQMASFAPDGRAEPRMLFLSALANLIEPELLVSAGEPHASGFWSPDFFFLARISKNLSENAHASLRTMRWIMAILIQASLVRGLIS
jgi:hypothetical protein